MAATVAKTQPPGSGGGAATRRSEAIAKGTQNERVKFAPAADAVHLPLVADQRTEPAILEAVDAHIRGRVDAA